MTAQLAQANDLRGEAQAYEFLEQLRWGVEGPEHCPHCGSDRGAWFLRSRDPAGRKSKGGTAARSQRRVWKCRESRCRRQFSVLTKTVLQGTKMPVQSWVEVVYALCTEDDGLSAKDVSERWGVAEKSAQLMLTRIQQALERPEAAGASLASNAPLWMRVSQLPIETTAQRAAASQVRRAASDDGGAARMQADAARALSEVPDPTADVSVDEAVELIAVEPVGVVDEPVELIAVEPVGVVDEPVGLIETQVPVAPATNVEEPQEPHLDLRPVKPRSASGRTQKPARQSTPKRAATRRAPTKQPDTAAASSDAPARQPNIDRQQVESDVQRVFTELTESEGLFVEGWLDEDVTQSERTKPSDADLGPSWSDTGA